MNKQTLALGLDLQLVPTADGGRRTPLLGGSDEQHRFQYRPNWGLPGWPDGDQTAGRVLGFACSDIAPGDTVRAIIVAVFLENVLAWTSVRPGDELRMYEGSRICGRAVVRWIRPATWFMPVDEQEELVTWLHEREDSS